MNGKVLVLGAAGFIGRHLVALLKSQDALVRVASRDLVKARSLFGDSVEIAAADMSDNASLAQALQGIDVVVNLAAETRDRRLMRAVNVQGTRNLLEACRNAGIRRFTHLSSAGVTGQYGTYDIDEETPCRPGNEYERTKLEAEAAVKEFAAEPGSSVRILRPTIVFGEGKETPDSFYQLLRRIRRRQFFLLDAGKGNANYVYAGDVAAALAALYNDEKTGCRTYLINDRADMRTLCAYAAKAMRMEYSPRSFPYLPVLAAARITGLFPGSPLTAARVKAMNSPYRYDSGRIGRETGFTFEYGLEKGITRTVEWLNARGWL